MQLFVMNVKVLLNLMKCHWNVIDQIMEFRAVTITVQTLSITCRKQPLPIFQQSNIITIIPHPWKMLNEPKTIPLKVSLIFSFIFTFLFSSNFFLWNRIKNVCSMFIFQIKITIVQMVMVCHQHLQKKTVWVRHHIIA